jgi:hypothetical protein
MTQSIIENWKKGEDNWICFDLSNTGITPITKTYQELMDYSEEAISIEKILNGLNDTVIKLTFQKEVVTKKELREQQKK